jgi:mediator of RNA polymerase II transcription subunit 8
MTRSALQRHNGIISSTLGRISEQLSEHHDLLSSLSVYPLPKFPGPSQSHILESLLRSKLEPDVEEWVEKGEALAPSQATNPGILSQADLHELWDWAPDAAKSKAWQQCWGGDYTLAERAQGLADDGEGWEKIVTGLERELEDPGTPKDPDAKEEEDDNDQDMVEEDEMQGVEEQPDKPVSSSSASRAQKALPMPLDNMLKFISTGMG